jgi:ADP-ribosyl-[dinitrogen reductase] hydrolase
MVKWRTSMDKIKHGILGVLIGDAIGLPVQFNDRAWFTKHPVTTMTGNGVFNKPLGSWSDDGSLTLALASSLSQGFNLENIMKEFEEWLFYGKYTQDGQAYDMGQTTMNAIMNYHRGVPVSKCGGKTYYDNGNGSLMRILPLVFYLRAKYGKTFTQNPLAMDIIHDVSALTHAHELAKMSCGIYLSIANEFCNGESIKNGIELGLQKALLYYSADPLYKKVVLEYDRLVDIESFSKLNAKQIGSSGFVKDTLEASLWCLLNSSNYQEAVLMAVNLGSDTDTTAAVCGGLAALSYDTLPMDWINALHKSEQVDLICSSLEKHLEKIKAA